jgi:hypothetical protein
MEKFMEVSIITGKCGEVFSYMSTILTDDINGVNCGEFGVQLSDRVHLWVMCCNVFITMHVIWHNINIKHYNLPSSSLFFGSY